jgi:ABC-type branched-subunit amino acid transport system substrate-binding protein
LLQKPVAAISVLSGVSDTLAPIAQEKGILLIGVNTATETFVKNYSQTQRINDRPSDHTAPIGRLTAKRFTRVGVMYSDDAFGQFCRTTFDAAFHQSNTNSLLFEAFTTTERDQNVVVQRLLSKQPDTVFVAGYGQGYISIFQALRTFRYSGPIFADIDFSNPQVLSALGDAADGVVFAAMGFNVTPPSTPKAAAFLDAYKSEFKREPWLGSAFAYDSLALMDHLRSAKQPLERQSIFALKKFPGIAAPLSFPSPGECQYVFQFVRRTAGSNVLVDMETFTP